MSSFFAKKWFIKELPSTENKKCITLFLRFTSISATSILKSKVHGRGKHHPYFCNFLFFSFLFFSFFFQFHSTWLWKMEWRWKIMVAWQRVKELLKRFQSSVVGAFDRRYGAREFDFYPQPWIFSVVPPPVARQPLFTSACSKITRGKYTKLSPIFGLFFSELFFLSKISLLNIARVTYNQLCHIKDINFCILHHIPYQQCHWHSRVVLHVAARRFFVSRLVSNFSEKYKSDKNTCTRDRGAPK